MKVSLELRGGEKVQIDLNKAIEISTPLVPGNAKPKAWYAPNFEANPVREGDFLGSLEEGGFVNFMNLRLNPHGNGTHTESAAHVYKNANSINKTLKNVFFKSYLISSDGRQEIGDEILDNLKEDVEAIVVRTTPNEVNNKLKDFSNTNPPFLSTKLIQEILKRGIKHIIIDLPSIDPEYDEGAVLAHKIFFGSEEKTNDNTITELVYIPNAIKDGIYMCNIQIPPFEIDAAPSRVFLYEIQWI
jgi:kynurenine formamidase